MYKCTKCGSSDVEVLDKDCFIAIYCKKCDDFDVYCGFCGELTVTKIDGMCIGQFCEKCNEFLTVTTYIPETGVE